MNEIRPSRRQLFGGFFAGLCAWLGTGRARAAGPSARGKPLTAWHSPEGATTVTTWGYGIYANNIDPRCNPYYPGRSPNTHTTYRV